MDGEKMESVSVILTTFNDGAGIRRVLNYFDENAELIHDLVIVSDECKDETEDTIENWMLESKSFQVDFTSRRDRHGRADAIRYGLKKTKRDITIIFAGDIKPMKDALRNLISYFESPLVGGVTGHPILLNGSRTIADCLSHIMWKSHDNVGRITTLNNSFFHLNGEIFGIRKTALKGFEDYNGLADDAMIGYCIYKNGYRVIWADDVEYLMQYPESLIQWLKIRKRCCYGRVDLMHKTGLLDYPFYELSHSEYMVNILRCSMEKGRYLLALPLGAMLEVLCRIYYLLKYPTIQEDTLFSCLWQPASETKW